MACEIIPPDGVKLNGSKSAFGGSLTSFTLNLGPIGSAQKASATLVGAQMTTPTAGEDFLVSLMGREYKMQVAGYTLSSSAEGATTMALDLADTSNRFLDNAFILLAEESGAQAGVAESNVGVLGKKFGPIPFVNPDDADYNPRMAIYTANSDTEWGDLRGYYEAETPKAFEESDEDWQNRVDALIRTAAGKVLYTAKEMVDMMGVIGPSSLIVEGVFDFKGSLRDVIGSYLNATGSVAWWDMEKEEVIISSSKNTANGLALLQNLKSKCELVSASESVDYTTTVATGAQGSITTSWPGENASWGGLKMSRYLRAYSLTPRFKYKTCAQKVAGGGMTVLDFNSPDVLKALRASVSPKVFAAYAFQSAVATGNTDASNDNLAVLQGAVPQLKANARWKDVDRNLTWSELLPPGDPLFAADDKGNAATINNFLADYYKYKQGQACSAGYGTVNFGAQENIDLDDDMAEMAVKGSADQGKFTDPKKATGKNQPQGWNNEKDSAPYKPLGAYVKGEGFTNGTAILGRPFVFDSIVSSKGFLGDNDILRMYLLALYKFVRRFWVIKANGIDRSAGYTTTNFDINGQAYGYYLTSSASSANINLKPPEGFKMVSVNPLIPLGECAVPELKALALVLSCMYLDPGTNISEIMGRPADPGNPDPDLAAGSGGAAVIDFIYALESDMDERIVSKGARPPSFPPLRGLEVFFKGKKLPNGDIKKMRRAVQDEKDRPEIQMHLLTLSTPSDDLADIPQFSFLANGQQRSKDGIPNPNEIQAAENTDGPAEVYAQEALIDLAGPKKLIPLNAIDKDLNSLMGLQTKTAQGGSLNLHGRVPKGFGPDGFGPTDAVPATDDEPAQPAKPGKEFIPAADFHGLGPTTVKVWYDAEGAVNSLNVEGGDVNIAGFVAPAVSGPEDEIPIWTSKMDLGLSVSAADIGTDNGINQEWEAFPTKPADKYSQRNRGLMNDQLFKHLGESAKTDKTLAISQSMSFVITEEANDFELPLIRDGLESLAVSVNGNRTELSLTVGGKLFAGGMKTLSNSSFNIPGGQYRPRTAVPDALVEGMNATLRKTLQRI